MATKRRSRSGYFAIECGDLLHLAFNASARLNNTMAKAACQEAGYGDLAIIDSQSEYDRVLDYFNSTYGPGYIPPDDFWINAYWVEIAPGNFTWYWEKCGENVLAAWAIWAAGEPDGIGTQLCSRITRGLVYRTIFCTNTFDALCEQPDPDFADRCSITKEPKKEEECLLFASCWWTPAKVGLTAGFFSLTLFLCVLCAGWNCICGNKNKVDYEEDIFDSDDEGEHPAPNMNNPGSHPPPRVHNIKRNYNIDEVPLPNLPAPTIRSVVLKRDDAPWLSPEELSFSNRHAYKE
ncbi:uncharacterized protein LOC128246135 [Mya arenaria]|uniref:uncharacterized protein LOC128246135 n=1 Tax=Mya arenaria TaxID=6604 RepID=UPI0022E16D15|nr:uncharacterized protein LOC128246135 [Mya arenaria]